MAIRGEAPLSLRRAMELFQERLFVGVDTFHALNRYPHQARHRPQSALPPIPWSERFLTQRCPWSTGRWTGSQIFQSHRLILGMPEIDQTSLTLKQWSDDMRRRGRHAGVQLSRGLQSESWYQQDTLRREWFLMYGEPVLFAATWDFQFAIAAENDYFPASPLLCYISEISKVRVINGEREHLWTGAARTIAAHGSTQHILFSWGVHGTRRLAQYEFPSFQPIDDEQVETDVGIAVVRPPQLSEVDIALAGEQERITTPVTVPIPIVPPKPSS